MLVGLHTEEDLFGRVPLFLWFLDGDNTATIPYNYAARQKQAFELGCAEGQVGPGSRRGSHIYVYEINPWLLKFGRPQPRVGGLSVAKTEFFRRKTRSKTSQRGWETKHWQACTRAAEEVCQE